MSSTRTVCPLVARLGAAGNTITKEFVTLRAALKLAARAGLWSGSLLAVLPADSINDYKPRTRWLTEEELHKLLAQLTADLLFTVMIARFPWPAM